MLLGAGRSYVGPDASAAGSTSDGGAAAPVATTGALEVLREPGHHVAFAVSSSSQLAAERLYRNCSNCLAYNSTGISTVQID